jgi:hypothetical protein
VEGVRREEAKESVVRRLYSRSMLRDLGVTSIIITGGGGLSTLLQRTITSVREWFRMQLPGLHGVVPRWAKCINARGATFNVVMTSNATSMAS